MIQFLFWVCALTYLYLLWPDVKKDFTTWRERRRFIKEIEEYERDEARYQ